MGSSSAVAAGPSGRWVALAMVGWLGLAACLTMVFLAMRAVMDIGGSCADGGPYVVSQACPEGSAPALLLGIFGGLFSGFVASVGGFGVGGIWAATPLLAWSALFGSLGWNFMDYGVFDAGEQGIEWGWAICGVVFWIMAIVPLVGLIPALRGEWLGGAPRRGSGGSRPRASAGSPEVTVLTGPGQPARGPIVVNMTRDPAVSADGRTVSYATTVIDGDMPDAMRAQLETAAGRLNAATAWGTPAESRDELARIAADFGAVIGTAMAEVPLDPDLRSAPGPGWTVGLAVPPDPGTAPDAGAPDTGAPPEADFTEGTQALLDRLERLADMRDRGLLAPHEYDTAKAAIMTELEGRS